MIAIVAVAAVVGFAVLRQDTAKRDIATSSAASSRSSSGVLAGSTATPTTSPPGSAAEAISWTKAQSYAGRLVTIEGPVVTTDYADTASGQPTFLNIGGDYADPSRFVVVIWGSDRVNFSSAPESVYLGTTMRVTGTVTMYQGHAQIVVAHPSQIEVAQVAMPRSYLLEFLYSNDSTDDKALYRPSRTNIEPDLSPNPAYEVLKNLHWQYWRSTGAYATGTMWNETSAGTWLHHSAKVWLSRPAWSGMYPTPNRTAPIRYFSHLRIATALNGGLFKWSWSQPGWAQP